MIGLKEVIGITSTIPVEIIIAAQRVPRDLNNMFITNADSADLVNEAERSGLPHNICVWVKGIYSLLRNTDIRTVIGVVQGDCTHMLTMLENLLPRGVEFIPFSFPHGKIRRNLRAEIQKLMDYFEVQWDDVLQAKVHLDDIRKLALEIDRRTWQENNISSQDNLFALVNCSDFLGDAEYFKKQLEKILAKRQGKAPENMLRLGLLGVPDVFSDLKEFLEEKGARVVLHEIARQFAMPYQHTDFLEQYLAYTYPYDLSGRLQDISEQTRFRKLDGYIHYVQSFCHHQLEDMVFREQLPLPILTLEGDRVGPLDSRTKTRLEAFIEMLIARQEERR
jgi:benzoyl-CoA reductase/2-hydroxyglutaryl-CoA dehydratase subunit BcrC/BadD/HgdB